MEQIRRVFGDNEGIILFSFPLKYMLWVLIRIASLRRFLWVPTTYVFMENWRKLSFSYHQIPSLYVLQQGRGKTLNHPIFTSFFFFFFFCKFVNCKFLLRKFKFPMHYAFYVNYIYTTISRECWIRKQSNSVILAKIKYSRIIVKLQYLWP